MLLIVIFCFSHFSISASRSSTRRILPEFVLVSRQRIQSLGYLYGATSF